VAATQRRSDSDSEAVGLPTAACLQEIGHVSLLGLSPTNLGSQASYRYGGRGPLPTKCMKMLSIKALTREASGTRSPTEPRH
jgi:hypothetical protein